MPNNIGIALTSAAKHFSSSSHAHYSSPSLSARALDNRHNEAPSKGLSALNSQWCQGVHSLYFTRLCVCVRGSRKVIGFVRGPSTPPLSPLFYLFALLYLTTTPTTIPSSGETPAAFAQFWHNTGPLPTSELRPDSGRVDA